MLLIFYFPGKFYEKSLKESGFFDVTDTDFVNFPVLFSPISNKKLL